MMTAEIAGLPFWELTFDADGDPDAAQRDTFLTDARDRGITDLIVFSHGWNNDRRIALELYERFFGILAGQLQHIPTNRPTTVGLAGVLWPSQLWSDEPIPDFAASAAPGGGAASLTDREPVDEATVDPTLDPATLANLRELFPAAVEPLDQMARLLTSPPTEQAQQEFYQHLKEFSELAGTPGDDGEDDPVRQSRGPAKPRMLLDDPTVLFERYRDAL
jgi:hypothetical protein